MAPLPQEHVEPLRAASLKTLSVVARLRGEATRARVSAAPGAPSPAIARLRARPESAAEVIEASADPDAAARLLSRAELQAQYEVGVLDTCRIVFAYQWSRAALGVASLNKNSYNKRGDIRTHKRIATNTQ